MKRRIGNRHLFLTRSLATVGACVLWICGVSAHAQDIAPVIQTGNEVSGVRILEPGKWGSVRTVVANHSGRESVPLVIVGFSDDPLMQFGTRVWLPAWSTREVQTLVLPRVNEDKADAIEIVSRLRASDSERAGGPTSTRVPLTHGRFDTAIIAAEDAPEAQAMVAALRSAAGLKPTTMLLKPRALPTSADGYEAIDSVFLCGRDLDLDPARREALIGFLERGGRLWVILDEAGPSWQASLLGDRWDISVLDSIEISSFVIKGPSGETVQEFDRAVPFIRVCAPGFDATHTIQGSPAALRKFVGRGQLIVSTLSPRGWLDSNAAPTPALADLQAFVAPPEEPKPLTPADMRVFDPQVRREIGYRVLGRGMVVAILGSALGILIVAALWASRRRRLELAAPASVACALVSGVVLIGLGRAGQSQTPSTSVSGQLVLYSGKSGGPEVLTRSIVYISPGDDETISPVRTSQGGVVVSDRTGAGSLQQTIWSDPDSSEVLGLDLRPGAPLGLTTHVTAQVPNAPKAMIGFDATGIHGSLDLGGASMKGPPLLVTPSGVETLQMDGHGTLRALEGGALGAGAVQSEEQIARQQVCRELLNGAWHPSRPVILVWSDLLDFGMTFPAPQTGSSLRAIPVEFEPSESGSEVSIPSVFLTPEPLRGSIAGRKSGAVYDPLKRAWLGDVHQPMLVMMQYRAPAALGSIVIELARFTFDLRASGSRFEVVIVRDGKLRVVGGGFSPAGITTLELSGDNAPELNADGRILIGIDIHGDAAVSDGPGWSLQRMDLSVRGRAR